MSVDFLDRLVDETQDVLTTILSQSRDCIELFSPQGDLEYINPNGLGSLGVDDPHGLVGRNWAEMWPPEAESQIERALERAMAGQIDRFEGYRPTPAGDVCWWDVSVCPIRSKDGSISHILAISRNITEYVNARLNDRLRREDAEHVAEFERGVSREMRHRLKNQLAVVGAVAKLLARHTGTARELVGKLEQKLQSLARAQDLLTARRDEPVQARDAIAQVLEASGAGERILVDDIPPASLPDEAVQTLALILGELQTNALKYGALRDEIGSVTLFASRTDNALTLRWMEDCGGPIAPVGQGNGGFQLIRRLGQLGSRSPEIESGARGIHVTFHVALLPE